ncbi:hypothetical protein ACLQ20_02840 [Micromonospora sp. DT46]|uniref:hypothetical protein n=1 Tax=Micromonospora sp. DT46 TaxID=3393435 RepID=UPI003CF9EB78
MSIGSQEGVDVRGDAMSPEAATGAITTWFRNGRTQHASGAFCGWREGPEGPLSPPYPEITGYALTFLTGVGAGDGAAAERAVDWLVARERAGDHASRPERADGIVYAFDVAMITHGLLRVGALTGRVAVTEAGLRQADRLVAAVDHEGRLACLLGDPVTHLAPAWSTRGQVHLLKCAQALLSAHEAGHPRARQVAERLVRAAVDAPTDGEPGPPVPTCPGSDTVSLHALCYGAEGLWVWGTATGDEAALRVSRRFTEWVWRQQLPDGAFPGFVRADGRPGGGRAQNDVLAQAVRLASLHRFTGVSVNAATDHLLGRLWRHGEEAAAIYWPDTDSAHLNSWVSMFAAQALWLRGRSERRLDWWELV